MFLQYLIKQFQNVYAGKSRLQYFIEQMTQITVNSVYGPWKKFELPDVIFTANRNVTFGWTLEAAYGFSFLFTRIGNYSARSARVSVCPSRWLFFFLKRVRAYFSGLRNFQELCPTSRFNPTRVFFNARVRATWPKMYTVLISHLSAWKLFIFIPARGPRSVTDTKILAGRV